MSEFDCSDHTDVAYGYLARQQQFDWMRKHRYKQRRCGECGLYAIVLSPEGLTVASAADEMKEGAER